LKSGLLVLAADMVRLNAPVLEKVTTPTADWPMRTLPKDIEFGVTVSVAEVEAIAEPDSGTLMVELEALLVNVTAPLKLPEVPWEKLTGKMADCPGESASGRVGPEAEKGAPAETAWIERERVPAFCTVICWVAVDPTFTLPKEMLDGVSVR
jgi:hypothetical protein